MEILLSLPIFMAFKRQNGEKGEKRTSKVLLLLLLCAGVNHFALNTFLFAIEFAFHSINHAMHIKIAFSKED